MIKPAKGYAFIVEDARELNNSKLKEEGFILSDAKLAGTSGIVYAINGGEYRKGDHVIFSKFVAEQIDMDIPDVPKGRLKAVPTDMILGSIIDSAVSEDELLEEEMKFPEAA